MIVIALQIKEKSYHLLVKFVSIFRLLKLQADFQQTPSGLSVRFCKTFGKLQTVLNLESSFGEHFKRDHFENS